MKRLLWTIQRFPGDILDSLRNVDPLWYYLAAIWLAAAVAWISVSR